MSKVIKDAPLTTKGARQSLGSGTHWRNEGGVHIGYRKVRKKGQIGGEWCWRLYRGDGRYWQDRLALADDFLEANGRDVLSYDQARLRIRDAIKTRQETEERAIAQSLDVMLPTVADAVAVYIELRERTGREKQKRDARSRLTRYVTGVEAKRVAPHPIAATALDKLTKVSLSNWRAEMTKRVAPATVARLSNDLRAALNSAYATHDGILPATFPAIVKDGLKARKRERGAGSADVVARADQILPIADVRRIVAAAREIDAEGRWQGDLFRLVLLLAATGARFSQVAAMRVADVQLELRRLMIPVSDKGSETKQTTHIPVAVTQDVMDELVHVVTGRSSRDPLLERWRHKQTGPATWIRDRRGPWLSASELTRPWAKIRDRCGLPTRIVVYALRHSSIVRGIQANLPVRHVASLHDTSAAMIERHYAAFIVSALDELAAATAIPIATVPTGDKVVSISARRR
ncbi:MAG: tyrosine-type recombinase/integrase [Labrys sp. (in: a-proteobacteria)]